MYDKELADMHERMIRETEDFLSRRLRSRAPVRRGQASSPSSKFVGRLPRTYAGHAWQSRDVA